MNDYIILITTLRGIKTDYITEYYYSGKVVSKEVPGTLRLITPILFFY